MPITPVKNYRRPALLFNAHLETIWSSLLRRPSMPAYRRERINTQDDDFLDLDWVRHGRDRLVVISHGLEGDSRRAYVTGMANAFGAEGWDVLAWNFDERPLPACCLLPAIEQSVRWSGSTSGP